MYIQRERKGRIMYNGISEKMLKQVYEYTMTDYGELELNDNAYSLVEDLLEIIRELKEELERNEND